MGIYRGGFRRYEGPLFPPAGRFTVILTHELAGFRRSRWVVLLFILAMLPLVVMTAAVFVKGTL